MTISKQVTHLAVRFYRIDGVELVLVPLLEEVASYTRSAGDGYFLVSLMGEPGTAYPLDLRALSAFDPDYLAAKFHLDRRGFGYTPEELAAALEEVAVDIRREEGMDR
jgi:hypothetical protein